ncbi:MAG TPA: glycosyltransferase family A protein, partial [Candidatus Binataceae bacterium]|nr:glycosyltransferase family A protein [Candidatus Binataceae bacterium]
MSRLIAITPARDERELLPGMIDSMEAQTRKPDRWIVIDDGSTDGTSEILDAAARRLSWIEPHHLEPGRPRAPGGESVVMRFLPPEITRECDFILRLDADLTFGPHLIAALLAEFDRDHELGIGGAVLYEPAGSAWREIKMPSFHTRGAVKFYSAECFAAIGGLQAGLGWDTIDEAHAMMLGYRTRNFRHIRAYHHRPQGAAGGLWKGRLAAGRAAYRSGYSALFMIARAAAQARRRPYLTGSIMMLVGYFEGHLRRLPRTASPEVARFV